MANENGIMYILSLVAIVGIVAIVLGMNSGSSAPAYVTVPATSYVSEDLSTQSTSYFPSPTEEEANLVGLGAGRDYNACANNCDKFNLDDNFGGGVCGMCRAVAK